MNRIRSIFPPLFFFVSLVFVFWLPSSIKSNPLPGSLTRAHSYELVWSNGGDMFGLGCRSFLGLPLRAITVDSYSSAAAKTTPVGQSRNTTIEGWKIKLDPLKLCANILFAATFAYLLTAFIRLWQIHRESKAKSRLQPKEA